MQYFARTWLNCTFIKWDLLYWFQSTVFSWMICAHPNIYPTALSAHTIQRLKLIKGVQYSLPTSKTKMSLIY